MTFDFTWHCFGKKKVVLDITTMCKSFQHESIQKQLQ